MSILAVSILPVASVLLAASCGVLALIGHTDAPRPVTVRVRRRLL